MWLINVNKWLRLLVRFIAQRRQRKGSFSFSSFSSLPTSTHPTKAQGQCIFPGWNGSANTRPSHSLYLSLTHSLIPQSPSSTQLPKVTSACLCLCMCECVCLQEKESMFEWRGLSEQVVMSMTNKAVQLNKDILDPQRKKHNWNLH